MHQDSGMEDHNIFSIYSELTTKYWDSISEMEAAAISVAKYATCKSQMLGETVSFTAFVYSKLL